MSKLVAQCISFIVPYGLVGDS